MRVILNLLTTLNRLLIYFTWKNMVKSENSCKNTFKKIMKEVRGVTPGYEKMQADSSHQQQH